MRRTSLFLASTALLIGAGGTSAADLSADFNQLFLKGEAEIPKEAGITHLRALATGDFDCDGRADLAIGDSESHVTGVSGVNHGSVSIAFGDAFTGFRVGGQLINQNTSGVIGVSEANDGFGAGLSADDFDANGCDDLAIGVPGEDDAGTQTDNSGGANVLFGATGGLTGVDDLFVPGTESAPDGHTGGHFKGEVLVSLNNWTSASALPFLAMSAVGHRPGTQISAGGVAVRRSGATALSTPVDFVEQGDFPGEINRFLGEFGDALAAGDFNNDGFDDLVVQSRNEACFTPTAAASLCLDGKGLVWVVYGASATQGFVYEKITQDSPNVPGSTEQRDRFGEAFAVGDFNDDGRDDLAIAAPGESIGTVEQAGSVTILYGAPTRLLANAGTSIAFDQSDIGTLSNQTDDEFGAALTSGDFNRDGFDDLAIGTPGEDITNAVDGGSVAVVYGSASGITTTNPKVFSLNSSGIVGTAGTEDRLGNALSAGDFNNDQVDDLAIGIDAREDAAGESAGAVSLIFSSGDTLTTIQSISPSPAIAGRPYTVSVTARRQNTGGVALGRGTVNVSVNAGGGSCVATLNNLGIGSCQITTATAGIRTVNASFPGVIGYRASNAAPSSLTVLALPQNLFANSFE